MFHQGKWSVETAYGDGSFWKPVSHSAPVWTRTRVLDPVYMPPQRGSARCMCWHQPHSHRPQKGGFYPHEGGVVLVDCCVSSWPFVGHRHKPRAPNLFLDILLSTATTPCTNSYDILWLLHLSSESLLLPSWFPSDFLHALCTEIFLCVWFSDHWFKSWQRPHSLLIHFLRFYFVKHVFMLQEISVVLHLDPALQLTSWLTGIVTLAVPVGTVTEPRPPTLSHLRSPGPGKAQETQPQSLVPGIWEKGNPPMSPCPQRLLFTH